MGLLEQLLFREEACGGPATCGLQSRFLPFCGAVSPCAPRRPSAPTSPGRETKGPGLPSLPSAHAAAAPSCLSCVVRLAMATRPSPPACSPPAFAPSPPRAPPASPGHAVLLALSLPAFLSCCCRLGERPVPMPYSEPPGPQGPPCTVCCHTFEAARHYVGSAKVPHAGAHDTVPFLP